VGIKGATEELKRRNAILLALLDQNKVKTVRPKRSGGGVVEARVVTPHSRLFLGALAEADELVTNVTSLWQACLIDDGQLNHANNDVSKSIRGLYVSARLMANGIRDRSQGRLKNTGAQAVADGGGHPDGDADYGMEDGVGPVTANPEIMDGQADDLEMELERQAA
ncbi:MAG: hypothetical protein ACOYMG_22865, partial [Candidatus Methylumidiphilus sp.]